MIDGLGGRLPPVAARAAAGSAATTRAVDAVAPVKPRGPDLSALAVAAREMASAPPVDAAKVDRIKNAIAVGNYKVEPDAVAERMIATDLRRG